MNIFKRLKNIWNLGELVSEDIKQMIPSNFIKTEKAGYVNGKHWSDVVLEDESYKPNEKFTVTPINHSFVYEGKPQAKIIKRKTIDTIKEILKQYENNSNQ